MSLELLINNDIKVAMRAKDKSTLRALRAIKSALLLAKTEKGSSDGLDEAGELKLLTKLMKQRKDSLSIYEKENREDLAAKELEEIAVIAKYLPEQMSDEDVKAKVAAIIAQTGASSMRDMGKVMGLATKEMAGKADGKLISTIVKSLLQ